MADNTAVVWTNATSSHVFHRSLTYEPLQAVRAEGHYIYLNDGRKLLDGSSGAAVSCIGHGNKRVIAAILDQLQTVDYVHSGIFGNKEAVETAIKLARQYHLENKQPERVNFIARQQSYHGNTLGALGLCSHKPRRIPYLPYFPSHFHHVSPCFAYHYKLADESDEAYVKRLADELEAKFQALGPHTVAAFFAETIVGATSGCTPAVPGYFKAMREVCDRHGVLFVLDEIMCGIGRTGKMHAWQWEDLSSPPDIQIVGKGLGGGYAALAGVLMSDKVVNAFLAGSGAFINGFTYQSHAVGCRAALEVLKVIKEDGLIEQCYQRGLFLEKLLKKQLGDHAHVGDIRHLIFVAVIVYAGTKGTVDGIHGDHILMAPPYTITEEELIFLVDTLKISIDVVFKSMHVLN
ncbi:unnamed protein product [Rotaria sordida]|uniref:Aminotransferase n=1 Tax=Rotaria sordida TaxID=392033 RepID=A0A818JWU2_9BILA|nr:unnamed protein product [Rotaria sordida]